MQHLSPTESVRTRVRAAAAFLGPQNTLQNICIEVFAKQLQELVLWPHWRQGSSLFRGQIKRFEVQLQDPFPRLKT